MVVVPWIEGWLGLCSCQWTLEWLCSSNLDLQSQRQVGHWKAIVVARAEAALWWWSETASCSAHHSFSSDELAIFVSAHQGDGPGLLCWVWKASCHTISGCSSVCHCNTFMAGLVLFDLVWSPKNGCFGMCSSPIQMMWPAKWSRAFSSITLVEVELAMSRTLRLMILSTQDGMECLHIEILQLSDMMAVGSPGLTAMEQWCEDNSSVDFQLCSQGHIVLCEHPVAEASKNLACLTDPHRDSLVKLLITWDHAFKVLEALDSLYLHTIDSDGGLRCTVVWCWLEKNLGISKANGQTR